MKNSVSKKIFFDFLKSHKEATLASVSSAGSPQAATVYYGIDSKFNLYVITGSLSRKFKNITKNPKVALVVTDVKKLVTIQIEGKATLVRRSKKTKTIVQTLATSLSPGLWDTVKSIFDPVPPVIKMENGQLVILKIDIRWMRWADFSLSLKDTKGHYFVELKI